MKFLPGNEVICNLSPWTGRRGVLISQDRLGYWLVRIDTNTHAALDEADFELVDSTKYRIVLSNCIKCEEYNSLAKAEAAIRSALSIKPSGCTGYVVQMVAKFSSKTIIEKEEK